MCENDKCNKDCGDCFKRFFVKSLPEKPCKNALYFVKTQTGIDMYVTNILGEPTLIASSSNQGVQITSNGTIEIEQVGQNFNINVSQTLQNLINSSLQPGDNISELNNDSQYITLADIPEQGIQSIQAGANVTVDDTDPLNPTVSVNGLGTAAFTDSTDYATSQQGDLADSAIQPNDNISLLTNDAGYITASEVPSSATNLSYTASPTQGSVNSDTGTDAVIPSATNTNAGLLLPSEKTKLTGIESEADVTDISIQNSAGVEQFRITDNIKFEGVSFSALDKKLSIDPLVPLAAFLDIVNGDDTTAVLENSEKPFKTIQALLTALPTTNGETYTIYITGGTVNFTRRVKPRSLKWVAYTNTTLDFTNVLENDGVTQAYGVIEYQTPLVIYNWTYENRNISIQSLYVGRKEFGAHLNTVTNQTGSIAHFGTLSSIRWNSVGRTASTGSFSIGVGTELTILNLYDSNQTNVIFNCDGASSVIIKTFNIQYGRTLWQEPGYGANVVIDRITQIGGTTLSVSMSSTIASKFTRLVINNITMTGTIRPYAEIFTINGNVASTVNLDFTATNVVTGTLISSTYQKASFFDRQTIFRNFNGKLGNIDIYNDGKLIFENCNIQTNTYLARRFGSSSIADTVEFIGSNTLTQMNTSGDLFIGNINIILNGVVKTNASSYGTTTSYQDISATFKEKLNEIVIRSKKDILKPLSSSLNYIIDGIITLLPSETIVVPVGGLSISGYGFDVSAIKATGNSSTIFSSPVGGCGNLFMSNISIEASGTGSKVFDLTNAGAPTGGADAIELNVVNFDNCTSLGTLTNFRQGLWDNIGIFGVKDGLILDGVWSGGFRSDLTIVRNFGTADVVSTLFKAGSTLSFGSRFWTDINADFKTSGSLSNFIAGNFDKPNLYQIKGAQITRGGVIDSTQNYTGTITAFDSVSDWQGNNGIANSRLVIPNGVNPNEAVALGQLNTALNLKANDADVLHKTGDEYKNGNLDASILSSGLNTGSGELRSYQEPNGNYVSLTTNSTENKSGIFRSNTDFFLYYDTLTGSTNLNSTFPGQPINLKNSAGNNIAVFKADFTTDFSGTVSIPNATASNHAAALGQVQTEIAIVSDLTVALVVSNLRKYYGLTGVDAVASLPPIAGNVGKTLIVVNKTSSNQNLFSNDSVANDIFSNGVAVNTVVMPIGFIGELFNDGVNWVIR